ncbi:MAG: ABC transporter substrate-binding protein [Chloroflexi bacterium]|nr:ABC transporter substrate-binding protein [Chloroflexota bacterium]
MKKLAILAMLLFVLAFGCGVIACDDGEATQPPETTSTGPKEDVVITIGNLTDITGVSANAQVVINMALDDLVEYYNEENLIPRVKLKVVTYDGQLDPAKDIPGYEWLKEHGADLIFTGVPDTPLTLKPIVDKEKMVLFAASGYKEMLDPPGYVFVLGSIPQHQAFTFLKWIAENYWDYPDNRPAKIGGASWTDGYSQSFIAAMKDYAEAHPEQFEWEGGYLTNFSFIWGAEVEALKDCDYVFPCTMPVAFVEQYRKAAYTAKFIGCDVHTAFFNMITSAKLWDEIDGMPIVKGGFYWWYEGGELANLAETILYKYHPDEAEEIIQSGAGYTALANCFYPMLEIIADAVEAVGPENFNSQALYDATTSYSLIIDGVEKSSFTDTRRYALTHYSIYEASASDETMVRLDPDWIPVVLEP